MPHRWRSGAMGRGVRAEGAMRGVGCARLRRAGAAESGEGRGQPREGTGQRDSIADGTALRNIVGEEVAATLRTSEIRLGGSFFV